jgi:hypothetical protein
MRGVVAVVKEQDMKTKQQSNEKNNIDDTFYEFFTCRFLKKSVGKISFEKKKIG